MSIMIAWNSRHFATSSTVSREKTPEEQTQNFYTDDGALSRSGFIMFLNWLKKIFNRSEALCCWSLGHEIVISRFRLSPRVFKIYQ